MHTYASSRVKSKSIYRKSELQISFADFRWTRKLVFFWHQSEARTAATVWNWSGKTLFPGALLAVLYFSFRKNCPPLWRLHTKLCKGAWNVSANNSETVGYKDLHFGQIVCILVFYNISFSWLLPLDGFQFIIFLCRVYCVTVKTKN